MDIQTILYKKLEILKLDVALLLVCITYLYFLRRFLDKNYIKNGILYTGSAHMCNIVYLLVKYFDFDLSHYHYSSKKINNKIIKSLSVKDSIETLQNYFFKYDENYNIIQCINLFNFPENFT